MIIQREIEAVMLAIDKLVKARIGMFDASIGLVGRDQFSAQVAMEKWREAVNTARIEICDALKDVIRAATGDLT